MRADTVIRGGRIFTGDPADPFVDAAAFTADRIVAVGTAALEADASQTIDLAGGLATPGFIDAHVHPASSGLDKLRCSFDDASDADSAVAQIAGYARSHPDEDWILGGGWSQSWFPRGCPSRELIDAVVPDRPVALTNMDGHGVWVNSRALQLAGIGAATEDPPDGRIERLDDGSPQGTLHEGAADLVLSHAPQDTVADYRRGLARGQAELLSHGVTGWQDAAVLEDIQSAYIAEADGGGLIGRVVAALWWDRDRGPDQIDDLVARREEDGPNFRPLAVKLMLDGVAENYTAAMLEPWLDSAGEPTNGVGLDLIDRELLLEAVPELDRQGFQCHFHAIGDRAVRNALDAVEAARGANGRSGNRHHIAHIQVVHPSDVPRFAGLDVVANAQPFWACNDDYQVELTRPFLGEERYRWQYPFGSLLRAGARLGMGSDWGVSTSNVVEEIAVAVTRTCSGGGEPLLADEALTPVEALTAFTAGSAFINHTDDLTGSIAVGKLADFAILDRDPLTEGHFRDARVVRTIVGGQIAYEAG